ncbi:MAG: NAD(P)/FAD-dependent oxidoreductase, partial [Bacteroidota bacterium]
QYQFSVLINWSPDFNEQTIATQLLQMRQQSPNQKPHNGNFTGLPSRLWEFLLEQSGIDNGKRWSDLTSVMTNKLAKNICTYEMKANGKTTFKEEFVSAGGIALSEIDVNTMMSKKHPGLFFGGEIMNVDGVTGGYNFQHAWTSGFIAAKKIAEESL